MNQSTWPFSLFLCLAFFTSLGAQERRAAVPVEPVTALVNAFASHRLVAVTAGHGEERGYALLLSLVEAEPVLAAIDDIVIEEGNSRYQDVVDRFTIAGETVSPEVLARVWRDVTQPMFGVGLDEPWERFFEAVRQLNISRPPERRLRVLLGDPPIDWSKVTNREEHRRWIEMRDTFPADLVAREVVARNRRALITYGQMHFQRKNLLANYESDGDAQTLVSRLEKETGTRVFTIWTSHEIVKLQSDAASWPVPSIAIIGGTALGGVDFSFYHAAPVRFALRDGKADFSAPLPRGEWRMLRAEEQFDAVLYPGAGPFREVAVSRERCANSADIEEHLRRMAIAGLPPPEMDRLKERCTAILAK